MGRKAKFDVKSLEIGQRMKFPRSKKKYIYQYLNNFNRASIEAGTPNRYRHLDFDDIIYIQRIE